jgi:Domain of unknown function (DUF4157)
MKSYVSTSFESERRITASSSAQHFSASAFSNVIHDSPRQAAQRQRMGGVFGPAVQRQEVMDEELQMQADPVVVQRLEEDELQLQELPEEEVLQGKFGVVQRVEEEESVQGEMAAGEGLQQAVAKKSAGCPAAEPERRGAGSKESEHASDSIVSPWVHRDPLHMVQRYQHDLLDAAIRPDLYDLPVQRCGEVGGAGDVGDERTHQAAAEGISGTGGSLPYLDTIQQAFGRHSVAHVEAHTDGAAEAGARAMGAEAFATGNHVAFAGAPSLHTAAHEAAHVVQQAVGVHLACGVGEAGDAYERQADAVADRVVRGESAEDLLGAAEDGAGPRAWEAGAVQRVDFAGWKDNMKNVSPGTASLAKIGMAIVNWMSSLRMVGRIGGSLSAAMFGGRRSPRDIDIDVPGGIEELNFARTRFFKLIKGNDVVLADGKDLFYFVGWDKTPEGYVVKYRHVEAAKAIDPLMDDDEVERYRPAREAPVGVAKVDFSSETAFSSSGINAHSTDQDPGFYGPEFLAASYLNRLATNNAEEKPDAKGDRDQVIALISEKIRTLPESQRPTDSDEVRAMLAQIKKELFTGYIKDNNKLWPQISALFSGIIPDVVKEVGASPTMEDHLRAIPSLPMHETRSREEPLSPTVLQSLAPLLLCPLNLDDGL